MKVTCTHTVSQQFHSETYPQCVCCIACSDTEDQKEGLPSLSQAPTKQDRAAAELSSQAAAIPALCCPGTTGAPAPAFV